MALGEEKSAAVPAVDELKAYLAFAEGLAREAGEIARKFFAGERTSKRKQDFSFITEADTQINDLVIERVKATYPGHDIIGEEGSHVTGASMVWVCDPIDGTAPFVYGLPYSCFELAFVVDGVPLAAVIYDFHSDRMYSAVKGQGAACNGVPISVNDMTDFSKATINQSSSRTKTLDSAKLRMLVEQQCYRMMILQCSSQEMALVANGTLEGGVFVGTTVHDVASAKLIIEEAGGKTSNLHGNDQRYDQPVDGMVYSNGKIHDELLAVVKQSLL